MFKKFLLFLIIFSIGLGFGQSHLTKSTNNQVNLNIEKNTPQAFISEVFDKVKENYWDNLSDAQILDLFKLSLDKNGGVVNVAKFENKDQLTIDILKATKGMDEDKKNKFVASVVNTVLISLNPAGRSSLYSQKQEEQLKNIVENINPQKDLYKDLGLSKGASEAAVTSAYQKQSEKLASDSSSQAQEKLKQLSYAKNVLTEQDTKGRYDQKGVEPTIFAKILPGGFLYVQFKKFSPTSYDEFIKAFDLYKDNLSLTNLIFDLRGNIGGAIDATSFFLGNFIGKNQYAFDFYHKGEYLPIKTPTEKLASISKYKQIVILVDNQTQSSAEIMISSFKKYHIGVVVGTPTKGWGTVERVFPIDNQFDKSSKYSLFLVHSITLRDDNQPIEGRGVEPDININDPNWQQILYSYFRNPSLADAITSVIKI